MATLTANKARCIAQALRRGRKLAGWRMLGSGNFSKVYASDDYPGVVLKLSGDGGFGDTWIDAETGRNGGYRDGYGEIKDRFPLFAQWAMKHSHLRGMPVIHSVEQLSATLWVTVMEHLPHHFDEWSETAEQMVRAQNAWLPSWIGQNDQSWTINAMLNAAAVPRKLDEDGLDWRDGKRTMLRKAIRAGEPYAVTLRELGSWIKSFAGEVEADMHGDNMRFRADGSLVFSDPVCGRRAWMHNGE